MSKRNTDQHPNKRLMTSYEEYAFTLSLTFLACAMAFAIFVTVNR